MTENALAELEKAGFIELKEEDSEDSLLAESQQVALEIRNSAIENAIYSSKAENRKKRALDESRDKASEMPASSLPSAFDANDELENLASRFSMLPPELERLEKPIFADNRHPEPESDARPSRPSLLARLKSARVSKDRALDDEPIKLKPVRHRASEGKSWVARFFFALVGLFVLAGVVLLLFPFNSFVPDLARVFSTAVGRPVGIREMRVDIYPEPGLVLSDVQLGQGNEAIRISQISLLPDLGTLFSERRGFRRVVVSGTALPLERFTRIPAIFAALADPAKSPSIGSILLRNTDISFSGIVLRDAEAEIQRDSTGMMQALAARSADRNLTLVAKPVAAGVELTVEAFAWEPGEGSKFVSDSLGFKGLLENDTLMISGLDIRIFGGYIQGDAIVHAGAKPNLTGTIIFERVDAYRLGDALGIGRRLSGSLAGNMRFSANSETWMNIFSAIAGEGEFNIQRGSIYGIDLVEVVRRGSEIPVHGGITSFEQMSGQMRLGPEKNQFYNLNMASGLMQSTGLVDVAANGRLAGRLELLMKGSVNYTRVPILVAGTLISPTLQPAR
ncbi:MAG: hypothetical protein LBS49_14015 [Candidatus Accumulibacter sp.]|nr:hypothetical protein [Accumulibacter sp.]